MLRDLAKWIVLAGLLLAIGGSFVALLQWNESGPELELSRLSVDLGHAGPGEVLDGILTLRNIGSEPLEFSLLGSCQCTELMPTDGVVLPGKSRDIRVGVTLPKHAARIAKFRFLFAQMTIGVLSFL